MITWAFRRDRCAFFCSDEEDGSRRAERAGRDAWTGEAGDAGEVVDAECRDDCPVCDF